MFTLPNIITLMNLLCGCLGFIAIWEGKQPLASYLIISGLVFDFLDGFVARITNTYSPIGKQLDSLADMVTFGALPAVLMFDMMRHTTAERWAMSGLFLAIFAALRLAKFNIDVRQTAGFIGLPTPAMAVAVACLPLIVYYYPAWAIVMNYNFLLMYVILLCWAMVAEMPLMAFKFKTWEWEENKARYWFIFLAALFIMLSGILAVPFIIIGYIIWSLLFYEVEDTPIETTEPISILPEIENFIDPEDILP